MPQNGPITVKDGAATPTDHVFAPTAINSDNIAIFKERVGASAVGYPTITWSVRTPGKGSTNYKVTGKLTVPKVVTSTGSDGKTVTSIDYTNLANIEFVVSEKSSKQERKDLRVLASNLLVNSAIVATVDDLESFW